MGRGWGKTAGQAAGIVLMLALGGCVTPEKSLNLPGGLEDPFEGYNRAVFDFNLAADRVVLRPVAIGYRYVVPRPVRVGVRNVLDNLDTPVILTNDLLQGELDRAGITLARFGINSTLGIGGIFDWAEDWGLPRHEEDFGQTLAVWGVGHGPYTVIPLLGPASVRDGFGRVVDIAADPLTWVEYGETWDWAPYTRYGLRIVEQRERSIETFDDLERTSIDFYAAARSFYAQQRAGLIANGEAGGGVPDLPDLPDQTLSQ